MRLRALIRKETLQILRDPSALLIAVVLPLILLFLYGTGVSLDLDHLRFGVVLEDTSPDARELLESFTNSTYFDVKVVRDRREVMEDIQSGRLRGFAVIPAWFSEYLRLPDQLAPMQVIADGSEANTANFVQYYAQGAFANWMQQKGFATDPIYTEPRFWFNEVLESRYFLLSGALAIIMTLIGTLLTALVVSREWERGTMEALIATPVTRWEIILGKTIPYFVLGMVSMVICVAVSTLIYGLPFRGTFFSLLIVSSCFLVCSLGIGLLISITTKVQMISAQISIIIGFLPAYILSGFLFEISSMPAWIRALTWFMPARYFVQSLQTLFLVGDVWPLLLKNMAFMLLTSVVLFGIIGKKMVKQL